MPDNGLYLGIFSEIDMWLNIMKHCLFNVIHTINSRHQLSSRQQKPDWTRQWELTHFVINVALQMNNNNLKKKNKSIHGPIGKKPLKCIQCIVLCCIVLYYVSQFIQCSIGCSHRYAPTSIAVCQKLVFHLEYRNNGQIIGWLNSKIECHDQFVIASIELYNSQNSGQFMNANIIIIIMQSLKQKKNKPKDFTLFCTKIILKHLFSFIYLFRETKNSWNNPLTVK